MLGKRLQIWRLSQFFLERLPSVEDVYVFRAVARENARDERLIALAEVRDASPLRDGSGRVVSVPHLERMAIEGLTPSGGHSCAGRPANACTGTA